MSATVPSIDAGRASSWSELDVVIETCVVCDELAANRTRTVPGVLPWEPTTTPRGLMLVGEAPGALEDQHGLPFVGRSGELLDGLLAEVGVDRAEVSVANVLKCRPPNNRPPRRGEITACRPWLERQIALARPAVVVALGSTAVTWFLGADARIGQVRGVLVPRDDYALIATYHPSAALRFGPRGKPMAALREDLTHAVDVLRARS
jgi:uracil-DNA glycosylase